MGAWPDGFPSAAATPTESALARTALLLYALFFAALLAHVPRRLFARRHARPHRLLGALHLALLLLGLCDIYLRVPPSVPFTGGQGDAHSLSHGHKHSPATPSSPPSPSPAPARLLPAAAYDALLGATGVALTVSATLGFPSHRAAALRNPASGALDPEATITTDEMVEHAFYQGLNLAQVAYLHVLSLYHPFLDLRCRLALLLLVTLPWAVRSRFPVNSFSKNYRGKPPTLVGLLYRLKKYQYLLYKHCLLHGLNITLALAPMTRHIHTADGQAQPATGFWPPTPLPLDPSSLTFRLFWISLNAAYVLEFFLQTLVKKGHMEQRTMLVLNQLLMVIATAPALQVVLTHVSLPLAALSLVLNLVNRGHELVNVAATSFVGLALQLVLT